MLAHPLEDLRVDLNDYAAEWKWDGIRIQLVHVVGQDGVGETRLYSRGGDDITRSFPEVAADFRIPGVADGELMVKGDVQGAEEHGGGAASFNALQQRLGRKIVSAKMLNDSPAFVRLYDILFDGPEDLRELGWADRRPRLEAFAARLDPDRFDVSRVIDADDFDDLERHPRRQPRRRDRGRDAQAPRQPLRRRPQDRAVVQMEARSARRRLRDDVRAARQRPPLVASTATIPSAASPRTASCCPSARPIRASPTRN